MTKPSLSWDPAFVAAPAFHTLSSSCRLVIRVEPGGLARLAQADLHQVGLGLSWTAALREGDEDHQGRAESASDHYYARFRRIPVAYHPQVANALNERFIGPQADMTLARLKAARDQGPLSPAFDLSLAMAIISGPLYFQFLIAQEPLTHEYVDRVLMPSPPAWGNPREARRTPAVSIRPWTSE
jgi:hypothetical protein